MRVPVLLFSFLFASIACGQNLLHQPESIVYDPDGQRHIVSNYETGDLVQIDSDGNQSYFSQLLTGQAIVGINLQEGFLYVACNGGDSAGVVVFDVASDSYSRRLIAPGQNLLNDIAFDTSGYIYVTDYWDSKIYYGRVETDTLQILFDENLDNPNGICFDAANNRLLTVAVAGDGGPILAINPVDSSFSVGGYTGLNGMDGIAIDDSGYVYVSNWTTDSIFRIPPNLGGIPVAWSDGHTDPADIYIDSWNNLMCVPNFSDNSVDFVPMNEVAVQSTNDHLLPVLAILYPCYPNPFNSTTTLSFELANPMSIELAIFDTSGRLVQTLAQNQSYTAGRHELNWDASQVASGLYIARLQTPSWKQTVKLQLVK